MRMCYTSSEKACQLLMDAVDLFEQSSAELVKPIESLGISNSNGNHNRNCNRT